MKYLKFIAALHQNPFNYLSTVLETHVAHQVLIKMLATSSACPNINVSNLTCEELSALFYVSGYVVLSVRRSIVGTNLNSVRLLTVCAHLNV